MKSLRLAGDYLKYAWDYTIYRTGRRLRKLAAVRKNRDGVL